MRGLRSAIEGLPVMVYALDSQDGVMLWNAECERTTGYRADEITGNPDALRLLYPDEAYRKRIVREWGSQDGWRNKEHLIACKDGSVRNIRFSNLSSLLSIPGGGVWAVGTDITDLNRKDDSLRQSVCEYRDLVEEMADLIYTVDTEGRMTSVNNAVKTLFGLEAEDVIGRKFDTWIPKEELANAVSVFKRVLAGERVTAETVVVTPDGSRYNVELSSTPIVRDGVTVGVRGIIRDITERKKRDEELKESEERFRTIFDNMADGLAAADAQSSQFYIANKTMRRMLGYSRQEFSDLTVADIHPEGDLPHVYREFARLAGEPGLSRDIPVKRKDGTIFYADIHSFRIVLDGKTYVMGMFRDVTERKERDETLKESEERFRTIFENLADGILLVNGETREFSMANKAFCRALGYRPEEVRNLTAADIHPEEYLPYVREQFARQMSGEITLGKDIPVKRKNGSIFYADISSFPITLAGKTYMMGVARNVTERRMAERALRESQERLVGIVNSVTDHMSMMDEEHNIVWANDTARRVFGEGLVGRKCYAAYHRRKSHCEPCIVERTFGDGKIHEHETEVIGADGSRMSFWCTASVAARYEDGRPRLVVEVSRDITERKQAHEQVRKSEIKYRTLVENVPHQIFLKDVNSVYISCNEKFARDVDLKAKDIPGKTDYDFYPRELADKYRADDRQVMESGQTREIVESYVRQGEQLIVHTVKTPVRDEKGNNVGVLGIFRDISEQKKAEEALRIRDSAMASSINGIAIADREGKLTYVNNSFLKMWGYSEAEELLGKSAVEFWRDKDKASEVIRALREKGSWIGELKGIRKDGSEFDVQASGSGVADEGGRPVCMMASFVDVTQARLREEQLTALREKMVHAEQLASLGTLSATVAHELTQPLTVIRLSIENSLTTLNEMSFPDSVAGNLADGLSEVSHATDIVERFRSLARKSTDVNVVEVDLKSLAERVVGFLNENARRARVSLEVSGMDELPRILSHERDLEQLLFALLENALQAADGMKERSVVISGTAKGDHIELRVSDTCGGIEPENLKKIFEPFFTTKPRGEGTGLGLRIVQQVVDRIGGKVRVESEFGKGTTFFVALPNNENGLS